MAPLVVDPNFTVSENQTALKFGKIFYVVASPDSPPVSSFNESNIDEGNWTTVVDFTDLADGGVDLDELIDHL